MPLSPINGILAITPGRISDHRSQTGHRLWRSLASLLRIWKNSEKQCQMKNGFIDSICQIRSWVFTYIITFCHLTCIAFYLSVFTGCFDVVFTDGHQLRNWNTTVIGLLMWIFHSKSGVYSAGNWRIGSRMRYQHKNQTCNSEIYLPNTDPNLNAKSVTY